jgi:glycine cleavage system H lipoate-binding protein
MRCPFLREEQVKSCEAAPFRKSVARSATSSAAERCSSPGYATCPVAPPSHETSPSPARCPFLRESLVQFCAATPRPMYVPWSASPELRCAHDGHRFCELFLAAAGARRGPARPVLEDGVVHEAAGVPMPGWLHYAPNHLWLDPGDDGLCHVGVDAFVAQLLGTIERLAFLTVKGTARPAVVLTARGVDLTLLLGSELPIAAANTRLRSSLDRLTADPYGLGWLFAVRAPTPAIDPRTDAAAPSDAERPIATLGPGLRHGAAALEWMDREVHRLTGALHARLGSVAGARLAADGGRFAPGLLEHLDREEALRLFASFFPIPDTRRTP